jgi:glycosyl transferase family 25
MTSLPIYIVTIPRAKERLDAIFQASEGFGLDLRPIDGVDGKMVPEDEWIYVNKRGFMLNAGRIPLPGEYGCYASHIIAMQRFLNEGGEYALIVEDDVTFTKDTNEKLQRIIDVAPKDALIKLTCHRRKGFYKKAEHKNGVIFGRYFFGPQGSSAAYLISRKAAERFLAKSSKMVVPYDRAIENGWDNCINVLNTPDDIFVFGADETLVATQRDYKATKLSQLKRIPKNIKAAYDNIARIIYALV